MWEWMYKLWAAYWLTVSELLHVVVKDSLFQGTFVIGRDRVSVAIGCKLSRPWHSERPRGRCVEQRCFVIQSGTATLHYIQSQSCVRPWRCPFLPSLRQEEWKSVKYVLIRDAQYAQKFKSKGKEKESRLLCIDIVSAIESEFMVHFS